MGRMGPHPRHARRHRLLTAAPQTVAALGAQAGEAAIRQVTADAGFTRFRRGAETPFNLVYEVRP